MISREHIAKRSERENNAAKTHHFSSRSSLTQALLRGALLILLAICVSEGAMGGVKPAFANTYEGGAILRNETQIEQLTNESLQIQAQIQESQEHLAQLEAQIPVQQERSDRALKLRYKNQSDPMAILDVLLQAQSLSDFLKQTEYIQRVSAENLSEINRLRDMKAEEDRLKAEIDARAETANAALRALQTERSQRQSSGVSKSIGQAASLGGEKSIGVAYDGGEQPKDYREAATPETAALDDGADWFAGRDEFIDHWAERLDRYLAGSPLAGQGENFAKAAWKYNIDPRWSAAISNTESSKGAYCIRPHNAWGWGAADEDPAGLALHWDSWEDAIDAHAKGLSEGYGYTISMYGARAYCPNTWQSWYNKTLNQMSQI